MEESPHPTLKSRLRNRRRQHNVDNVDRSDIIEEFQPKPSTSNTTWIEMESNVNNSPIQSVHDTAEPSTSSTKGMTSSRERMRSRLLSKRNKQPQKSLFDEEAEEVEINEAYERHQRAKSRWVKAAKDVAQKSSQYTPPCPTIEEAYDFFTRQWEDDTDDQEEQISTTTREDTVIEIEKTSIDKSADKSMSDLEPLLMQQLEEIRQESDIFKSGRGITMIPYKEVMQHERDNYYFPSTKAVPMYAKFPEDHQVRYPEDEGLYVGRNPAVALGTRRKTEQRIFNQGKLEWFSDNGHINALPNPLRSHSIRIATFNDIHPALEVEYVPAKNFNRLGILGTTTLYELELDIGSITFSHHHLFSTEHVLVHKLTELCENYFYKLKHKQISRLKGKLETLRESLVNAKQSPESQPTRLKKYRDEIIETRRQRDVELAEIRRLLESILTTWKSLRKLRNDQGYSNTSLKLQIHIEKTKKKADKQKWDIDLEKELEEIMEEHDEVHKEEFGKYKKRLEEWKKLRKTKKKKKLKDDEDDSQEDETRPVPPEPFNEDQVRKEIKKQFNETRRAHGEPKISLEFTRSNPVTQDPISSKEKQRRSALDRCKIYLKIYYNNKEVCRTVSRSISSSDSTATFGQIIPIRIMQMPDSLKVQIWEGGGLYNTLISEIFVPLPDSSTSLRLASIEKIVFCSNSVISHNHAGVGSGQYLMKSPGQNPYTSGHFQCRIGWAQKSNGTLNAPPNHKWDNSRWKLSALDPLSAVDQEGRVDIDKLKKWAEKSQLDPNDPKNSTIMMLLKESQPTESGGYFRLNNLQSKFDFCTMEEIENNLRFRILQLRDNEVQEFKNLRMIPLHQREIAPDIFQLLEKEDTTKRDRIISSGRSQYLQRVRNYVMERFQKAQHKKQLSDIVMEDPVPDFGTLGITLVSLFEPSRPLKPMRRERKKVVVQNLLGQQVEIIVNIQCAFEVPGRCNKTNNQGVIPPC